MTKKTVKKPFGILRLPNGRCKPSFASCDEAVEFLGTFTYPEDYEIVNLILHPEYLLK